MDYVKYKPIGIIKTPNVESRNTPIQQKGAKNIKGESKIFEKFSKDLKDLEGFSHIILIYHFHRSKKCKTFYKKSYMDDKKHGVLL